MSDSVSKFYENQGYVTNSTNNVTSISIYELLVKIDNELKEQKKALEEIKNLID